MAVGDVVIANFIYSLDFGKIVDGKFRRRPEYDFQPDRKLLSYVEAFLTKPNTWKMSIASERPDRKDRTLTQARFGYVASSNKVIDDASSDFFVAMRSSVPEIHAVEMEAAGACAAIRLEQAKRAVGFLMVRGISDHEATNCSDGSDQRAAWKEYASAAAAAFVANFIRTFPRSVNGAGEGSENPCFDHRCKPCVGRGYCGAKPSNTCKICAGKGHLLIAGTRSTYQQCRPCGGCGHYGSNQRKICSVCNGLGLIPKPSLQQLARRRA